MVDDVTQWAESLPSMHEAQGSSPEPHKPDGRTGLVCNHGVWEVESEGQECKVILDYKKNLRQCGKNEPLPQD